MNRRHFLQAGAAGLATLLPLSRNAWALATPAPTQRKLVVIMLRGAVDGLNVVVPYGDADYYQLRGSIAIPKPGVINGVLDLDGFFGMHPAMTALQPLWQNKSLAFVHASGSPDATRSHFDAQDYMESGTPGRKGTADGWMNRLLGQLPGETTPTRAMAVGATLPRILSGRIATANIEAGANATKADLLDRPAVGDAFAELYKGDSHLAQAYHDARQTHQEVMMSAAGMEAEMVKANEGAPLPNGFPADAARLARMMRSDARMQMVFMALGGWDTHVNQGGATGQLANRLSPLAQGLNVLAQNLGPMYQDTTIVVMSEFGRTAHQNGTGGTDHGHGNAMWVLGGDVAGGKVYGQWPSLAAASLHENRDLAITTDFRQVLAQIATQHLRLDDARLAQIFPQAPAANPSFSLYA